MTAISVLKQRDGIHVLTDGAIQHGTSTVLAPKAFPVPHLDAIVTARGPAVAACLPMFISEHARAFDDLEEALPVAAKGFCDAFACLMSTGNPLSDALDIVVAGRSKRHGPTTLFLTTSPIHGVETYKVHHGAPVVVLPGAYGAQEAVEKLVGNDVDAVDPRRVGAKLMRAQRDIIAASGTAMAIGGFCQITSMWTDPARPGITTEVLEMWPG